jgi:hypothetical protein
LALGAFGRTVHVPQASLCRRSVQKRSCSFDADGEDRKLAAEAGIHLAHMFRLTLLLQNGGTELESRRRHTRELADGNRCRL